MGEVIKKTICNVGNPKANKLEVCSNLLGIRDTLIKTTITYHFTPKRLAKFRKLDNAKCWKE